MYAGKPNVPEYMVQGGATYRNITDQVGSIRLVVNATTGVIAQRIDWDEFGRVLIDTAPGFQPFGFAGGLYEPNTGFVRFGARDYDPADGRWSSRDVLRFAGGLSNLYSYVGGDAVNRVDPDGLTTWVCQKPLDFLGGKNAPSAHRKSWPLPGMPTIFNDLFHQYLCTDADGQMTCGGLGQKNDRPFGPGKRLFDGFNPDRCDPISRKDCIDRCVKKKIEDMEKHPPYYLLIGYNCQDWSNEVFSACERQCMRPDGIWPGP